MKYSRPARTWAHAALALLASLAPVWLAAQTLTGRVVLPTGGPAAGVLLVALPLGSDSLLRQIATAEDGRFTLPLPTRPVRVRALRIGHHPTELGQFTLGPGERREVTFELVGTPVQLRPQVIAAAQRCLPSADAGEAVVTLLQEVRKALTLTTLRQSEGSLSMRVATYTMLTSPDGRALGPRTTRLRAGSSSRPFQGLPPALLSEVGYVSEGPAGSVYRAPDARLFLSHEFEADYCLRVEDEDDSALLGLAFSPIDEDADIVRIRGVLWVDRASLELTRLDYRYEGLRRPLSNADLGGSVSFTRLPNGVWFEDDWQIRMPRTSIVRRAGLSGISREVEVLSAIQTDGGKVLSVAVGSDQIYATEFPAGNSLGSQDVSAGGAADAFVELASCTEIASNSAEVLGTVRRRPSTAIAGATVSAEWKERFRVAGYHQWSWQERALSTSSATDGSYALCGVPADRLIELSAALNDERTPTVGVRAPAPRVDLWFSQRP